MIERTHRIIGRPTAYRVIAEPHSPSRVSRRPCGSPSSSPCDRPRLLDILHGKRAPLVLRALLEHIDRRIIPTETPVLSRADTAVCTRRSTRGIHWDGDHVTAV